MTMSKLVQASTGVCIMIAFPASSQPSTMTGQAINDPGGQVMR
jgi:hypothetical protein